VENVSHQKKILSQIHPTMNSALNTRKTYQNSQNLEDMPSAMYLAAMPGGVAASYYYKINYSLNF